MSRPFKGVIVPLESFIEPVHEVVTAKTKHLFLHRPGVFDKHTAAATETVEFFLIKKLLEDQFLLDVRSKSRKYTTSQNVLDQYIRAVRGSVPDYEILFSRCFHDFKMRMWYFPDTVYLEHLGDSVIVTWKKE